MWLVWWCWVIVVGVHAVVWSTHLWNDFVFLLVHPLVVVVFGIRVVEVVFVLFVVVYLGSGVRWFDCCGVGFGELRPGFVGTMLLDIRHAPCHVYVGVVG